MKAAPYTPIPGGFDLSKLNLPKRKLEAYRELQVLGEEYQRKRQYYKKYNKVQHEMLEELLARMNLDLILNYGALEEAAQAGEGERE